MSSLSSEMTMKITLAKVNQKQVNKQLTMEQKLETSYMILLLKNLPEKDLVGPSKGGWICWPDILVILLPLETHVALHLYFL